MYYESCKLGNTTAAGAKYCLVQLKSAMSGLEFQFGNAVLALMFTFYLYCAAKEILEDILIDRQTSTSGIESYVESKLKNYEE